MRILKKRLLRQRKNLDSSRNGEALKEVALPPMKMMVVVILGAVLTIEDIAGADVVAET